MKNVLITVISQDINSKVLDMVKNSTDTLGEFSTQHIFFKKGINIDLPEDGTVNIILVELKKYIGPIIQTSLTTLYNSTNVNPIFILDIEDNITTDDIVSVMLAISTRGFAAREWGGSYDVFLSNEEDEILNTLKKEIE